MSVTTRRNPEFLVETKNLPFYLESFLKQNGALLFYFNENDYFSENRDPNQPLVITEMNGTTMSSYVEGMQDSRIFFGPTNNMLAQISTFIKMPTLTFVRAQKRNETTALTVTHLHGTSSWLVRPV
jgi:hypothetical protein